MDSQPTKLYRACKAVALILACSTYVEDGQLHTAADLFEDAARYFPARDAYFEVDVDDAKRGISAFPTLRFLQKLGFIAPDHLRCRDKKSICAPDVLSGLQIKILKNLCRDEDRGKPLDPCNTRALKDVTRVFTSLLETECNIIFDEKKKKMEESVRKVAESASQKAQAPRVVKRDAAMRQMSKLRLHRHEAHYAV